MGEAIACVVADGDLGLKVLGRLDGEYVSACVAGERLDLSGSLPGGHCRGLFPEGFDLRTERLLRLLFRFAVLRDLPLRDPRVTLAGLRERHEFAGPSFRR